ncbi:MAG: alpha/beta hydrolase [Rhodospirillaceae bacterium]|nr:alpha/beta hydrolase [Rhodospirillaceae bacterium]
MSQSTLMDRRFVRIAEGLVHVREVPAMDAPRRPLYLMHPSPASARGLEPLLAALRAKGATQRLIAPDTLGNGDSAPPTPEQPDIAYFADSVRRVLDALKIDKVDVYGAHTGCRTAAELAIIAPDRVGKVIFDGIAEYDPELKKQILTHYAPAMEPDDMGRHLVWAFHFVRDQIFHFPYFMRDPAHKTFRTMPSNEHLHAHTVDVLKGLTTYHKAYLAAFHYEPRQRLPLIKHDVLVLEADTEPPHLKSAAAEMAALVPGAKLVRTSDGVNGKAAAMAAFLDA